ncbi:hypothetical protein, partial [Escherichia coli]|uniref:hypothetical protein n=1 Tax=Escherichia coli TaxID=562 RepID=UPI0032B47ECF
MNFVMRCLVPPGDVNQLTINAGYREPTHKNQYGSQLAFLTVPRALSRIHHVNQLTINAGYREPTHKNQYGSQLAFLTVPRALSRIH